MLDFSEMCAANEDDYRYQPHRTGDLPPSCRTKVKEKLTHHFNCEMFAIKKVEKLKRLKSQDAFVNGGLSVRQEKFVFK